MLGILTTQTGHEWNYILEYFGQKLTSFWGKNGYKIMRVLFIISNIGIALCVALIVIGSDVRIMQI
jgi:hypothetical protein